MQSHMDRDYEPSKFSEMFMAELQGRAAEIRKQEKSKITSGEDGEPVVAEWKANGVGVVQRPNDPQNILRISIGGGDNLPVSLNYCVFRGDRGECVDLLRKALKALESDPE